MPSSLGTPTPAPLITSRSWSRRDSPTCRPDGTEGTNGGQEAEAVVVVAKTVAVVVEVVVVVILLVGDLCDFFTFSPLLLTLTLTREP